MLNIPMNFNMLNPAQLDNAAINNPNQKTDGSGDFMNIEFNIKNSSVSNKENCNSELNKSENIELKDEKDDIISSFEKVLDTIIKDDEELKLNEDISFLQSIVSLFNKDNILENSSKSNSLGTLDVTSIDTKSLSIAGRTFLDKIYDSSLSSMDTSSLDTNSIDISSLDSMDNLLHKINDLSNTSSLHDIKDNHDINLSNQLMLENDLGITKELIVDFTQQLDEDFIAQFNNIDDIQLKKDSLIEAFKEFILEYNSSTENVDTTLTLDDSYDVFKTNFKLSMDKKNTLDNLSLDSLDSIDMIEFLSNDTSMNTTNNSQEIKFNDLSNTVLRYDMLVEDLEGILVQMKNYNLRQLKLKLSPKELGDMVIDLSQINETSNIKLTVSNPETLDLIKSNINEIKEYLKENHIISDASTVTVEADTSQRESFNSNFEGFTSHKENREGIINKDDLDNSFTQNESEKEYNQDRILNILA